MDLCACGRPLWDGMHVCEACMEGTHARDKQYRERVKFSLNEVSGYERSTLRNRLASLGRGYDA